METTSTAVEIERLERKVDMSLDEIIKMQKKLVRKAKKGSRKPSNNTGRNAPQGSVASHFSAKRKGKLAQLRPQGNFNMLSAKRAGFKASNGNDRSKTKRRNRRRTRNITGPKGGDARSIMVLVSNELSRRKGGVAARSSHTHEKLKINDPERNLQTLDSRFASLKGGRQVQFDE